ncbi:MAG: DNA polymerase III subunit delta [Anaerolineae bacterium]|nr:DNA polymerase III subunit delta [Anaerolineae bacterium]
MIHIYHGENSLAREESLAKFIKTLGLDDTLQDLNTETFSHPVDPDAFRRACSTMPFLGDKRIIIVRDGLHKANKDVLNQIAEYLPDLPGTTEVIFSEDKSIGARNPILKQAKKLKADIQQFAPVKENQLPHWIQERAKSYQVKLESQALALLAQNIGPDLRLLDQEIQKLKLYKGGKGLITVEDVRIMVPYVQSADVIFNMVDALGQRNARKASQHLHRLLNAGEHPLGIFGMVTRQYRLLIQTSWLLARRNTEKDVASILKLHPFVAGKICAQANYYSEAALRQAYNLLLESDLAIKQGKLSPDVALDLLVAELTRL